MLDFLHTQLPWWVATPLLFGGVAGVIVVTDWAARWCERLVIEPKDSPGRI